MTTTEGGLTECAACTPVRSAALNMRGAGSPATGVDEAGHRLRTVYLTWIR